MRSHRLAFLALAILFFPISRPTSPTRPADLTPLGMPAELEAWIGESCLDCHGGQTRWPLYSRLLPVAIFMDRHIRDGRAAMDLSAWAELNSFRRQQLRTRMHSRVADGRMPLRSYRWGHPASKPSTKEVEALRMWAEKP